VDVVLTSLEAWDAVWRRNQHLVAGLMRRDPDLRVLFVEPSTDPLHAALDAARPQRGRGLRPGPELEGMPSRTAGSEAGRLWLLEPTKWLPRRIDSRVDERWARQVLRAARRLGFEEPVLWVNDPTGASLVSATTWPSLYDITDDWTQAVRLPAETERVVAQESVLLERCDEVVVCSPGLAATKGADRPVTLVPNGVDTAAYLVPHERPDDLPPGPVALYVGTLHSDRLDLDLCVETAEGLEGAGHLVLVGPDALEAHERARLEAAGVVLLGARDASAVPAYLQNADVLVVPHTVTPFTDSLDPIKAYEYAAARRPVVASPVAGFRDSDDPHVVVSPDDYFVAAVHAALSGSGEPVREPSARRIDELDWSHRVEQMAAVIGRLTRLRETT
jgi:glycosyltransferase involved in cell wall biosynthesis